MSLVVMVCGCHSCGRNGHYLWPSWFVAVIVGPKLGQYKTSNPIKFRNSGFVYESAVNMLKI